jgi:hypothetical protein
MHTLLFFSLFAFGVFSLPSYLDLWHLMTWWHYGNPVYQTADSKIFELNRDEFWLYLALNYNFSEKINTSSVPDFLGYHAQLYYKNFLNVTTLLGSTDLYESFSSWRSVGRIEPCGNSNSESNWMKATFNRTASTDSENITTDIILEVAAERTEVPDISYKPFVEYIRGDGLTIYRTVKMYEIYYDDDKNLMIKLSTLSSLLSSVITEVILATGDQCVETFNASSEDHIIKTVPDDVYSFSVTVPAKDIWFIGLRTTGRMNDVKVEYMSLGFPKSSSFIPRFDLLLMVVLLLSIFIYRQ